VLGGRSTVRRMTDDRLSALALIAGSCGLIITMTLHPTGRVANAQMESMLRLLIAVHALAIACIPVLFLGVWGLSRRLGYSDRIAVSGLVVYALALLAVMNAAVADGLVNPGLFRQFVASAASRQTADSWRMISRYNFFVNQAYAQVYVAASSVALLLWSVSALRSKSYGRGLGIYGCILGPLTLLALFSGHLSLDAHVSPRWCSVRPRGSSQQACCSGERRIASRPDGVVVQTQVTCGAGSPPSELMPGTGPPSTCFNLVRSPSRHASMRCLPLGVILIAYVTI
jgi:hypothetical protein